METKSIWISFVDLENRLIYDLKADNRVLLTLIPPNGLLVKLNLNECLHVDKEIHN